MLFNVCVVFVSDVDVTGFTVVPSSSYPLPGIVGLNGVAFSVTLSNAASASPGNSIQATSGTDQNFKVGAVYHTSSTLSGPPFNTDFSPTVSVSSSQQALTASGASITVSGTIDYPAMTIADCIANTHICIVVLAETTASYVEHNAQLGNNYHCEAMTRTCSPGIVHNSSCVFDMIKRFPMSVCAFAFHKHAFFFTTTMPIQNKSIFFLHNFNFLFQILCIISV